MHPAVCPRTFLALNFDSSPSTGESSKALLAATVNEPASKSKAKAGPNHPPEVFQLSQV